jgi:hypothetical protein
MFVPPNLCLSCEHFDRTKSDLMTKVCSAFPEGMPRHFWEGASHFDPLEDESDRGITYEPRENMEEAMEAYLTFWYDHDDYLPDNGPLP